VYDLHTFEPVVKGPKNVKKSKTTRIYCKDFNKLKYFNKNQGGVKVVAGSKLSRRNHMASFWRQQRPKSAMFLATLFHAEQVLQ
jgi:hypothetical protein